MNQEMRTIFTRRIASGNKSEIIEILFEIFMAYTESALEILEKEKISANEKNQAADDLKHAIKVVDHLRNDLDFTYEISAQLYALYDFVMRGLSKSLYSMKPEGIREALVVMKPLEASFKEVARQDESEPVMQNTQQVTAGYTYGKGTMVESMTSADDNRGFLV